MSEENEDEREKKLGTAPSMPPPSMPPPATPAPSMPPPTTPAPSMPPQPSPTMPPQPSPTMAPTPVPEIPSGPSQQEYDALLRQVEEKNNTINQLNSQLSSLQASVQASAEKHQKEIKELNDQTSSLNNILIERDQQIDQLSNEKVQLENRVQESTQEVLTLQQQLTPLQQRVGKLQEEVNYQKKRIEELKEPKAVMPSTLAQQSMGSQSPISSSVSTPSAPVTDMQAGRRVCPNCNASGFAIKEVEDKSKIISYIPKPIYAKKMLCTKCGYEF